MARGFFLTFEGLDGSGKSTQLRRLSAMLAARGERITVTRQPGGTRLGDRIRALLLDSSGDAIASRTELALMFADRAQAIADVIRPALAREEIVLCDRFTDSTEAYQGGGRELGSELVLALHAAICEGLQPDLTLLLLPDLAGSLGRARRRNARSGSHEGRFEQEDTLFYQRVFDAYRAIAARDPDRVVALSGERSIERTHTDIVAIVDERLRRHRGA
jgi:dTMP kinase